MDQTALTRPAPPGSGPWESLPTDLESAVRTGPLHLALDLAIRRRRISLEALQRRLAERGLHIGLSTLSYWRRGHRHPEGDRSVRALRALEDVLELPDGSLVALAGGGTVRRGQSGYRPLGLDVALGLTADRMDALTGIDPDVNFRLSMLSTHFMVHVDADRAERSTVVTCVVSSRVDGADRFVYIYETRSDTDSRPVLGGLGSCRLGRVRTEPEHGLVAAELRFDHPLRAGETYVFDYEVHCDGEPMRTGNFEHGLRSPCRQIVMRASFDPAALPVACYRYYRTGQEPIESTVAELPLGASRSVHAVTLDARPGVHGIRWDWD